MPAAGNCAPLALPEARRIRDLVEGLPEPRRTRVKERFAAARARLADAGLLASLEGPQTVGPRETLQHGEAYFALGVACPFLEDESCSIYEERPLICREYVVVSPPERCATSAGPEWRPWPRRCPCGAPSPAPPPRATTTGSSTCR